MATWARSEMKFLIRVIAADSRVSVVFFLNAKPKTASFLWVIVLKRHLMIRCVKL